MEQPVWRGMPYFDVFGRKKHLTRRELRAIRANCQSYIYWFLVVSLFVLLDLHGFVTKISIGAAIFYTVALITFSISFYFYATLVGLRLSKTYSKFFLIYPIVGFIAVGIATFSVEVGVSLFFSGEFSVDSAVKKLPVNLILGLLMETIYLNFVFPVMVSTSKIDMLEAEPDSNGNSASVMIAGKLFECEKVSAISSQDHYVRIKTDSEETLLRARLSDLIEHLNCQNGIQPHRSHWVSRRSVKELVNCQGKKFLKLNDGTRIPIARGRVGDVQEWLEK